MKLPPSIILSQFLDVGESPNHSRKTYNEMKLANYIAMLSRVKEWTIEATASWEAFLYDPDTQEYQWKAQNGETAGVVENIHYKDYYGTALTQEGDLLKGFNSYNGTYIVSTLFAGWSGGRVTSPSGNIWFELPSADWPEQNIIAPDQTSVMFPTSPLAPFTDDSNRAEAQLAKHRINFLADLHITVEGEDSPLGLFAFDYYNRGKIGAFPCEVKFHNHSFELLLGHVNLPDSYRNASATAKVTATEYWEYDGRYDTSTGQIIPPTPE